MNPSRGDPCPCGSGKKFKNCHLPDLKVAAVPARTKPEAVDYHMVMRDGNWERRPGLLAVTLGGKKAEDVDEDIENLFDVLIRGAEKSTMDRIRDLKHKLYAARYHLQMIERRIDDELARYGKEHRPAAGAAWETEDPVVVYETEAFLFQTKSALDLLTQLLSVFVPRLRSLRTFRHSGEVRDGSFVAGGKVLKELKTTGEKALHDLLEAHGTAWIQDLVVMRDEVTHFTKIKGLRCFVERPYRGGETAQVELPTMPNDQKVDAYCQNTYDRLIELVEACVGNLSGRPQQAQKVTQEAAEQDAPPDASAPTARRGG